MYENKISARQLRRMIFIETFGAGALSIPAFACYKEQNGFWSLIFYGVFLAGTIAFFIIFSTFIRKSLFCYRNTKDLSFLLGSSYHHCANQRNDPGCCPCNCTLKEHNTNSPFSAHFSTDRCNCRHTWCI